MSTVYFLIGCPASGKSTWRAAYLSHAQNPTVVISSDDALDQLAADQGKTYSEVFKGADHKQIERDLVAKVQNAVKNGEDLIIDRTNMNVKSRSKWLSLIPKTYKKKAVVFQVDRKELQDRLDKRAKETGKHIPTNVVDSMLASFQMPTHHEFDDIEVIS